MTTILIVEDDPRMARTLRINLQARGFDAITARDGHGGLQAARMHRPDLILLDLGLPDLDGVEIIQRLRPSSAVPIVVLSGRADSRQKVAALDAGADDYMTKPFSLEELLARIRAVTRRRPEDTEPAVIAVGQCQVDLQAHTIRNERNEPVHLSPTEWEVLEILLQAPGRLVRQGDLLEQVWGPTYREQTHYLRQYLTRLRRKLEPDPTRPRHLLTDPGVGYRFQP